MDKTDMRTIGAAGRAERRRTVVTLRAKGWFAVAALVYVLVAQFRGGSGGIG